MRYYAFSSMPELGNVPPLAYGNSASSPISADGDRDVEAHSAKGRFIFPICAGAPR